MNRFQATTILGICILCVAPVPLLLPRASFVGAVYPDPIILSAIIGMTGIIVLLIAYVLMFKS